MNRRDWLKRAALIATGAVAGDQLDLIERLTHRKVFALGAIPGIETTLTLNRWKEVSFMLTDKEMAMPMGQLISDHIRPAQFALEHAVLEDTERLSRAKREASRALARTMKERRWYDPVARSHTITLSVKYEGYDGPQRLLLPDDT